MTKIDPIELSRALIRRPSVTPADEGALDVLEGALTGLGFSCTRLKFDEVDNLFARYGDARPHFCFAGHTDVVPPGETTTWSAPPFGADVKDGMLWGRGAADMKCAIAAFAAAAARAIEAGTIRGSLSFLITGDEEGPAINGTRKVLEWMREQKIEIDHCLVGEPSNPEALGDMIKVGRRGSINCWLTVTGKQGHVAYPDRAQNPIPALLKKLLVLSESALDDGYDRFQPSNLEITDIHIGNPAHNVIPEKATARFNIRFNPNWTGERLKDWLTEKIAEAAKQTGAGFMLETVVSGEAFLTTDMDFIHLVQNAAEELTGRKPELSTSGGTSDARFIKDHAPVCEFGMVGATMHQTDERVAVDDIARLADVYELILKRYFEKTSR